MRYQYVVITINNASDAFLTEFLDKHGKDGWELVQVVKTERQDMLKFVFKMAIQ